MFGQLLNCYGRHNITAKVMLRWTLLFWAVATPAWGTVVFTLAIRDGIVMGADGLTVFVAGDAANPSIKQSAPAEPKIAVCGNRFLCGMAGINPFPKYTKIKYDFQDWISTIQVHHRASPRQFSKSITRCRIRTRRQGKRKREPRLRLISSFPQVCCDLRELV
jgi:hypothetical protein